MTEKPTVEQMLSMLYHFQKKASADFNEANQKVADKLKKNGIELKTFTDYALEKEKNDTADKNPLS